MITQDIKEQLLRSQKNEISEHLVYSKLSAAAKIPRHAETLAHIAQDELAHYNLFKTVTGRDVAPDKWKVFYYVLVSRVLGLNFGLKLMENGEQGAQEVYGGLKQEWPEIETALQQEQKHEFALLALIDEDILKYTGSLVLGISDAIVEFTAALAGYTLALQHAKLIGIVGLITGIAAATSMSVSEYLSTKHEETDKTPMKAGIYTGVAYILAVILLILPYFLFGNIFLALGAVIVTALVIIFLFTFYISVVKGLNFRKRFMEMAGLSLGVALVTFFIGLAIRQVFGVEV